MLAEQLLDHADGGAGALDQRVPVARVGNRRRQHVGKTHACRSRAAAASRSRTCRARRPPTVRCPAPDRGRARGNARWWRPAGAGPCPQITSVLPRRTSCTITGTSPPGPLRCGSTTCSVKAVATAASKALPPFSSIAHADRGRDPMRRGDDAEGALDLGARRERVGIYFGGAIARVSGSLQRRALAQMTGDQLARLDLAQQPASPPGSARPHKGSGCGSGSPTAD